MATHMKAHKIRMNPTPEQREYLQRAAGTRRFIYNWGLAEWNRQYAAYEEEHATIPAEQCTRTKPTAMSLRQEFNAIREKDFPWTQDVTKCVVEGAFFDLKDAFSRYFDGQTQHPIFKKKGKSYESFYISNDKFTLGHNWISVPVLGKFVIRQRTYATGTPVTGNLKKLHRSLGTVNLAEKLRFVALPEHAETPLVLTTEKKRKARKKVWCYSVKIMGATVSYRAGWWYASINVQVDMPSPPPQEAVVGIDVGLKTNAMVSDGRVLENQKPLLHHLRKLGRAQRDLSRCQKVKDPTTGYTTVSKNYQRQRITVARIHKQIADIRKDTQHKFTTEIARTCRAVGIENLHIRGMLKNRRKARATADAARNLEAYAREQLRQLRV